MSKVRFWFYGLTVLFFLGGLYTGNRIFIVLYISQILLLLAALAMDLWAAFSFTYLQELSQERTLRGRPVRLKLAVHNEKPVPYPLMRIRLATPGWQEKRELSFNLAARSSQDFDLLLECPHRGEYAVGMTIIDFIDVFGLLRLPFDMRLLPYYRMKNLLVYPRLTLLDNLALPALASKSFSRQVRATENQDEPFSMTRDYRRGDPRKLIHWKASLRQQKLQTRTFELSSEPNILLVLDLGQPALKGEAGLQAIDVCCECAAALIHYVLRQNWILRIIGLGQDRQVKSGHGMNDFQKIYQWLAQVPFDGRRPLMADLSGELAAEQAGRQAVRAIVVITARPTPDLLPVLMGRRHGHVPVYTLLTGPAEVQSGELALRSQLQQAGLPAWFIHYGADLAESLRWVP